MDSKNLDAAIYLFNQIAKALEGLKMDALRSNLDITLGCMQLCDRGKAILTAEKEASNSSKPKGDEKNGESNSGISGKD